MSVARRAGTTSVATLFACALTVFGGHWVAPRWAESVGLDVWAVPALQSQLEETDRQSLSLSELIEESHRRMELKENLIDELLGGRLTLKETTREFMVLNRGNSAGLRLVLLTYEGGSDEEKQARNVVQFALQKAAGSPFHALALAGKYEAEIRRTYAR